MGVREEESQKKIICEKLNSYQESKDLFHQHCYSMLFHRPHDMTYVLDPTTRAKIFEHIF